MEEITTSEAFESTAPLSQAIRHENTVYVSGNVPIDPEKGELVDGGVSVQTETVLENISAVLDAAGTSMENVVRAGVFLRDERGVYEVYVRAVSGSNCSQS
jgi:2-iminobutanoate/2-iminopropanoate deaminase